MSAGRILATTILTAALCCACAAQHRDPLTQAEAQQLRASAQTPERRVHLLLTFAADRLLAAERNGFNTSREKDLETAAQYLQDFAVLIERLDAELADYDARGGNLQSSLRKVLEDESGFARRLNEFHRLGAAQQRKIGPSVQQAVSAVESSQRSARSMLNREQPHSINPPGH